MTGSLKIQRILVAVGLIFVAFGDGSQFWAVSYGAPGIYGRTYEVYGAAVTVGYGLLAWSTWEWLKILENTPTPGFGIGKVLRLISIANLAFAIGTLSITYYSVHQAVNHSLGGRLRIALPTTEGLELFGFLLVSAGLWSAAAVLRSNAGPGQGSIQLADAEAPV